MATPADNIRNFLVQDISNKQISQLCCTINDDIILPDDSGFTKKVEEYMALKCPSIAMKRLEALVPINAASKSQYKARNALFILIHSFLNYDFKCYTTSCSKGKWYDARFRFMVKIAFKKDRLLTQVMLEIENELQNVDITWVSSNNPSGLPVCLKVMTDVLSLDPSLIKHFSFELLIQMRDTILQDVRSKHGLELFLYRCGEIGMKLREMVVHDSENVERKLKAKRFCM